MKKSYFLLFFIFIISLAYAGKTKNQFYIYPAKHVVTDSAGNRDSLTKTTAVLTTNSTIIADFTYAPTPVYTNARTQFTDASITTIDTVDGSVWSIDGGAFMSGKIVSTTFTQPGNYIMLHKVYTSIGEMDTISKLFTVLPLGRQPLLLCPSRDTTYLHSFYEGPSYQWQVSADRGVSYYNISDNINYIGASQRNLEARILSSYNHYYYRCLVEGNTNPEYFFEINFSNYFRGWVDSSWENPANWHCNKVPDANTDVVIPAGTRAVLNSNAACRSISVTNGGNFIINPGFTLTLAH